MKNKYIFKYLLSIFLIYSNFSSLYSANISILEASPIHSIDTVQEYDHLSPFYGKLVLTSGLVRTAYDVLPSKSFIREIFYAHEDNITFGITKSENKFISYATPFVLGVIIGFIEGLSAKTTNSIENLTTIIKYIFANPHFFESYSNKADNFFNKIRKEKILPQNSLTEVEDSLYKRTIFAQIDTLWQESLIKKVVNFSNLTSDDFGNLSTEEKFKYLQNFITTKNLTSNINKTCEAIIKALGESLANKRLVQQIFLAAVWEKLNEIGDIYPYFFGISFGLYISTKTLPNAENWRNLRTKINTTASTKFDQEYYNALLSGNYLSQIPLNIDRALLVYEGPPLFQGYYPTYIKQGAIQNAVDFPDCVEISILNMLNVILFNAQTRRFNSEILEQMQTEESNQSAIPKIQDFYGEYIIGTQNQTNWTLEICTNLNRAYNIENPQKQIIYGIQEDNNEKEIKAAYGPFNVANSFMCILGFDPNNFYSHATDSPFSSDADPKTLFDPIIRKFNEVLLTTPITYNSENDYHVETNAEGLTITKYTFHINKTNPNNIEKNISFTLFVYAGAHGHAIVQFNYSPQIDEATHKTSISQLILNIQNSSTWENKNKILNQQFAILSLYVIDLVSLAPTENEKVTTLLNYIQNLILELETSGTTFENIPWYYFFLNKVTTIPLLLKLFNELCAQRNAENDFYNQIIKSLFVFIFNSALPEYIESNLNLNETTDFIQALGLFIHNLSNENITTILTDEHTTESLLDKNNVNIVYNEKLWAKIFNKFFTRTKERKEIKSMLTEQAEVFSKRMDDKLEATTELTDEIKSFIRNIYPPNNLIYAYQLFVDVDNALKKDLTNLSKQKLEKISTTLSSCLERFPAYKQTLVINKINTIKPLLREQAE
jgi:hypothetical protein